jgi:hypothetical protein
MSSAPKKSLAQVEAESQSEIADILGEIETLQKEMADQAQTQLSVSKPADAAPALRAVPTPAPEAEPAAVAPVASVEGVEDFHGAADEPSLEETLGAMKGEEGNGQGLLDATLSDSPDDTAPEAVIGESFQEAVEREEKAMESQEGSLTMTLTGNMTLKLRYEFEGQEVTIGFSDGALRVELSDGTEFKVPVARPLAARAA